MSSNMKTSSLVAALASAATVAAHGHVSNIVINGVSYQGYDPTSMPYQQDPPAVVGWTAADTDNGFVAPSSFGDPDIICHKSATPGGAHVEVAAGDSISIQWNTWPESHKGPMIDYLAACSGDCEDADKTALEFFKIDGAGYDAATSTWASDVLVANNNSWLVQIPSNIAPGNYVLRHETIALHSAGQADGAQAYPQCFNLAVTGSGTDVPAGVLGTALYKEDDAGIIVDIYNGLTEYTVPGPALIDGAVSSVAQATSAITASGTATVGAGSGSGATSAAPTSAGEATSQASPTSAQPTTAQPTTAQPTTAQPTTAQPTTAAPSTLLTSTRAPTTSAVPAPTGGVSAAALYGQCGGKNWTGATSCAEGTCKVQNPYYSQCINA
ncbi:glycoside hydrolase 61 [Diatrype stigma]|uniref:lytic cellulose monooxygenase (C4-dehydrogenating) n=1 Tax=Diatrype stigma TaxID=117547 RepID=A0AAN9YVL8_9PEZI